MFLKIRLLSVSICLEQLVPENYSYSHMYQATTKNACILFLLNIFIRNHISFYFIY